MNRSDWSLLTLVGNSIARTGNDTAISTLKWTSGRQIWSKVSCSICKPGTEKGNYYGKEEGEEEEENIPLTGRNSGKIDAAQIKVAVPLGFDTDS
jgi:hypothetical protein